MGDLSLSDYMDSIRRDFAAIGEISAGSLDQRIPHIEGWTVAAVIGHTGWVARYVTQALAATPEAPPSRSAVAEPPPSAEVMAWFNEGAEDLLTALESADPDTLRPTFTGAQPARWWIRRMAHEFAMHRWDAFSAIGSPEPIDAKLAEDGIDEVFQVFTPARARFETLAGTGETVHLHATDIEGGEWSMTLNAEEVVWERSHTKADVAARGPVSDLLLLLWSRIPPSRLELFGEATILERWQEAAKF